MSHPGNWVIRPMGRPPPSPTTWKTWIIHKCRKVPGTNYYYLADVPSKSCPTCSAKIPNDIWCAWKLQNSHMMKYLK